MAAPSKLNQELIKKFAAEVEDGLPLCYCCDLFSVTKSSFSGWMKQGESDFEAHNESIYAEFFNSIKMAYARFIQASKKRIYHGESGWAGTAWWLERTNQLFVLNSEDNSTQETVIVNPSIKRNHES